MQSGNNLWLVIYVQCYLVCGIRNTKGLSFPLGLMMLFSGSMLFRDLSLIYLLFFHLFLWRFVGPTQLHLCVGCNGTRILNHLLNEPPHNDSPPLVPQCHQACLVTSIAEAGLSPLLFRWFGLDRHHSLSACAHFLHFSLSPILSWAHGNRQQRFGPYPKPAITLLCPHLPHTLPPLDSLSPHLSLLSPQPHSSPKIL